MKRICGATQMISEAMARTALTGYRRVILPSMAKPHSRAAQSAHEPQVLDASFESARVLKQNKKAQVFGTLELLFEPWSG